MQDSSIGQLSSLISDVAQWWRNWWGNRAGMSELDKLDREGMKHIARDVGTSTEELQALAGKWPDSVTLNLLLLLILCGECTGMTGMIFLPGLSHCNLK